MAVLEKKSKKNIQLSKISFGRAMQKRFQVQVERVQNDASFDCLVEQLLLQKNV